MMERDSPERVQSATSDKVIVVILHFTAANPSDKVEPSNFF